MLECNLTPWQSCWRWKRTKSDHCCLCRKRGVRGKDYRSACQERQVRNMWNESSDHQWSLGCYVTQVQGAVWDNLVKLPWALCEPCRRGSVKCVGWLTCVGNGSRAHRDTQWVMCGWVDACINTAFLIRTLSFHLPPFPSSRRSQSFEQNWLCFRTQTGKF